MISYELRCQLKDADFPKEHGWSVYTDGTLADRDTNEPTLSELIEACGEEIVGLDRIDGGWQAAGWLSERLRGYEGASPTEAVARLWLALHKK